MMQPLEVSPRYLFWALIPVPPSPLAYLLLYLSLPVCRVLAVSERTIDKQTRGSWLCGTVLGRSWYAVETEFRTLFGLAGQTRLQMLLFPIKHLSRAAIHEMMDHGVVSDQDQRLQVYPFPSWPTGPAMGR